MYYLKNLYIFFWILSLFLFFFSTTKVHSKAFEITNIEISKPFEKDFNKNQVLDEGFNKAFFKLIRSLIKSSDLNKVNIVKLKEIKSMIESFTIQEEKFINEIYYVNLGVSFERKKIFKYLEKKNIFPSQPIKETFLFIPIIIDENINELKIFSNNILYKNWNKFDENNQSDLIKYILPTEDLEDYNLIKEKYDAIENYDFKEITEKYFLKNTIIAMMFKNEKEIRVLSRISIKNETLIKNKSFNNLSLNDEEKIALMIDELKKIYEDTLKEYNQINTSIKLPLIIRVDNDNSDNLIRFEKTLEEMDLINKFSIQKFDKSFIYYEIIFNGTPKLFLEIMSKNEYEIDNQKRIWVLK
jgi:hypothetical protein